MFKWTYVQKRWVSRGFLDGRAFQLNHQGQTWKVPLQPGLTIANLESELARSMGPPLQFRVNNLLIDKSTHLEKLSNELRQNWDTRVSLDLDTGDRVLVGHGDPEDQERYAQLRAHKSVLDRRVNRLSGFFTGLPILITCVELATAYLGTYYLFSWDIMEPICYMMALTHILAASLGRHLEQQYGTTYRDWVTQKLQTHLYNRANFNLPEYGALKSSLNPGKPE